MTFWTICPKISLFLGKIVYVQRGNTMEDHSLTEYLKRRTNEELESILQYYLQESNCRKYKYAIKEIHSILKNRLDSITFEEITQQIIKTFSQIE